MRYFFLLLLYLFLCTGVRAQNFTITASIGLATDQCNPVITDPNADCIGVPLSQNMLTYLPGQDGDIIITYRLTNNTAGTITMGSVTDSDRGVIVPVSSFTINPGQTVTANRIFPAETVPRTVTPTVTANVQNASGLSATVTGNYTLDVVAPQVSVEFGVARQADVCNNQPVAANCGVPFGALNGQTVTVGALDTFTTRFAWTNEGLGLLDMHNLVNQDGIQIADTGFDLNPGQTLISSRHWAAPALPGTYNFSQLLTVTDKGGNTATATVTYIVIVQAPMVSIEFGVARQADVCDNTIAPNCPVPYGALTGQTVTVGALDTFTTRFAWTNEGLGVLDVHNLKDQDGFVIADTGFDQNPGQTLISSRHWAAPALPGTYNFSQLLTVTDKGGNTATATVTYVVIVQAPMVTVQFGVANQNDVCPNQPIAPNCGVPFGPLNGQNVTVGAGDTVTTRFSWTNAGLGILDLHNLVDQDGIQLTSTGFDQSTGQTLSLARHFVAPGTPGIYDWSQTLTVTDKGGNIATVTVNFEVEVDCTMSDLAPPVALCRDRSYTILEGETQTINAGTIDNGSFDGCGALAGGSIDRTSFNCDDEGPNTVTLTVGDFAGNSATCTSTVTINVENEIYTGENNFCRVAEVPVSPGQTWWDVRTPAGKLIAQVNIGNNTNIASVGANVFRTTGLTEEFGGQHFLSKRANLRMYDAIGDVVQPNAEPVYVRLYYTITEIAVLVQSTPVSQLSGFALVKTSGFDCGSGYTGANATLMNTTIGQTGCANEDRYFEFSTNSFSTFYLFATDAVLPVELAAFEAQAIDKQRVQLDWMTSTETDNDRFEIEHSSDGENFALVGAVAGAGESSEEQWYDFVHETPFPGLNYYRLRQLDYDGTETLSEVRVVEIEGDDQLSVYPNPTADELRIRGFAGGPVRVLDTHGRAVLAKNLAEGQSLNVGSLAAGVYLLQLPEQTLRWVKR